MRAVLLLVDGNRNIREFCKRELERDGHHVFVAGDVKSALRLLSEISVDLVVADAADAPEEEFLVLVRTTRSRSTPVIVHGDRVPHAVGGLSWTPDALVEKSGDLTRLRREIEKAAGRKATAEPSQEGWGEMQPGRPSDGSWDGA